MQEHSQEQKGGGLYALRVESTAQWRCKGAGCPEHPVAVRLCSILEGRFKLAALRTIPSIPLSNVPRTSKPLPVHRLRLHHRCQFSAFHTLCQWWVDIRRQKAEYCAVETFIRLNSKCSFNFDSMSSLQVAARTFLEHRRAARPPPWPLGDW